MQRVYLDYNATAPLLPKVTEAMREHELIPLNPSSTHYFGRMARKVVEDSRRKIADIFSVFPHEVYFCGSATEANNWVIQNFLGKPMLVSAIEHRSVLDAAPHAERIPVDAQGVVRLDALERMLQERSDVALVSIMLANNETGVVQPVAEAASLCRRYGALLHCDAVQGVGRIAIDCGLLGADYYTISSHKCGGPLGIAALISRSGNPLSPLLRGGGQERRMRAGTEHVRGASGLACAVEQQYINIFNYNELHSYIKAMESKITTTVGNNAIISSRVNRLPNTSCILMPGVSAEVQLMHFDLAGFALSAGAACASGKIEPSHVLKAMGIPEAVSSCAIRMSAGWATTREEIQRFTAAWIAFYEQRAKPASGSAKHLVL